MLRIAHILEDTEPVSVTEFELPSGVDHSGEKILQDLSTDGGAKSVAKQC